MDIAVVISLFAVIVSIISPIYTYRTTKRINTINLFADHLKSAYATILTKQIPEGVSCLYLDNQRLCGVEQLQGSLQDLMNSISFYRYYDADFYSLLMKHLQGLEDYLLENANSITEKKSEYVFKNINGQLTDIYYIIKMKYING